MAKGAYKYFTTWRRAAPKAASPPSPSSRTFEAFTRTPVHAPPRTSAPSRNSGRVGNQVRLLPIMVVGGVILVIIAGLGLRETSSKEPWVFDSAAAQRPSLQVRHTLY